MVTVPILVVLLLRTRTTAARPVGRHYQSVTQKAESAEGFKVMNAHFPAGEFSPLNLLIESPQGNMIDSASLQAIEEIAQSLQGVPGVSMWIIMRR